jgi:hypothetical protein
MQPGELIERAGREEHFAAVVGIFTLWAGQHGDGIAAEVLVETLWGAPAAESLVHGHRVVFVVVAWVELGEVREGS